MIFRKHILQNNEIIVYNGNKLDVVNDFNNLGTDLVIRVILR